MVRHRGPPSQTWRTFLRNHADAIAAIDLCVVPTLTFERLFAFLVVGRSRRQLLWFAVTGRPTAEWLAQQIVEAFALQARGVGKDAGGQYSAVGADATQPAGVNEYRLGTHTGDGSCRRDPGRATTKDLRGQKPVAAQIADHRT